MTHPGRDRLACCVRPQSSRRRFVFAWTCLASCVAFCGCASTEVIQANNVPQWLQAPTIENPKTLDLSRLATGTYGNDTIDRGDVLEVTINAGLSTKDNVTIPVRVTENGMASLPVVGEVPVLGFDLETSEAAIAAACVQRGIYRNPHVTVTMKRQRMNRIMVGGAVKSPGTYPLPRGSADLLSALAAAGFLADNAGTGIEIRNASGTTGALQPDRIAGGSLGANNVAQTGHSQTLPTSARSSSAQSLRVDLVSATKAGANAYPLGDGAIVMVERRDPPPIQIMGLVKKPDTYEYPIGTELTLLGAISKAGGVSNLGANKIFIIRQIAGQAKPTVIEASLRAAKRDSAENLKLAPGDVVSIEQTPTTVLLETLSFIRFGIGTSLNTLF